MINQNELKRKSVQYVCSALLLHSTTEYGENFENKSQTEGHDSQILDGHRAKIISDAGKANQE